MNTPNTILWIIILLISIYYIFYPIINFYSTLSELFQNDNRCDSIMNDCGFITKEELKTIMKKLQEKQTRDDYEGEKINELMQKDPRYSSKIPRKRKGSGPNGELVAGVDYEESMIQENQEKAFLLNEYAAKFCKLKEKYELEDSLDLEGENKTPEQRLIEYDTEIANSIDEQTRNVLIEEKNEFIKSLEIPTIGRLCKLSYFPKGEDPFFDREMIELRKQVMFDMYGFYDIDRKFKKKLEKRMKKNYFKGLKYYDKNKNKRRGIGRKNKKKKVRKEGIFGEIKEAFYLESFNKEDNTTIESDDKPSRFEVPQIDQGYLNQLSSMGLALESFFDSNIDNLLKARIDTTIKELEYMLCWSNIRPDDSYPESSMDKHLENKRKRLCGKYK